MACFENCLPVQNYYQEFYFGLYKVEIYQLTVYPIFIIITSICFVGILNFSLSVTTKH